jgi:hypothetical protein
MMGYIVVVVPRSGASEKDVTALRQTAHDTFVKAMHERISTSVVTTTEADARASYLEEGGDIEKWPEALGGGFEPVWKVPHANAIVFDEEDVGAWGARVAAEAITSERMLAVRLPSGKLKRVTGLVGHRLTVDS